MYPRSAGGRRRTPSPRCWPSTRRSRIVVFATLRPSWQLPRYFYPPLAAKSIAEMTGSRIRCLPARNESQILRTVPCGMMMTSLPPGETDMLDHIGFAVSNLKKSTAFYSAALQPLGIKLLMELTAAQTGSGAHAGFGTAPKAFFWIGDRGSACTG